MAATGYGDRYVKGRSGENSNHGDESHGGCANGHAYHPAIVRHLRLPACVKPPADADRAWEGGPRSASALHRVRARTLPPMNKIEPIDLESLPRCPECGMGMPYTPGNDSSLRSTPARRWPLRALSFPLTVCPPRLFQNPARLSDRPAARLHLVELELVEVDDPRWRHVVGIVGRRRGDWCA
jgi:hypothetical protein